MPTATAIPTKPRPIKRIRDGCGVVVGTVGTQSASGVSGVALGSVGILGRSGVAVSGSVISGIGSVTSGTISGTVGWVSITGSVTGTSVAPQEQLPSVN